MQIFAQCVARDSQKLFMKQTNRKFIGIEMDDKYFKIAKERINDSIF